MARKKTITREQILDASYSLIRQEGFTHFTARNIASTIGCSTQPIYLEFKNMTDLKNTLFDKIYKHLSEEVFPKEITGDPIIDLSLNYIDFAKSESRLFHALYIENSGEGQSIHNFSWNYFKNIVSKHEKYKDLDNDTLESLLNGTWIIATGIANLSLSGTISPSEAQKILLIQDAITGVLGAEHKIEIDF
jgi:AcrR family transcriptional regulator